MLKKIAISTIALAAATPAFAVDVNVIGLFPGKAVVVKLGGNAIDHRLDQALAQDVLLLRSVGVRCVVVHGGGKKIDATLGKLGGTMIAARLTGSGWLKLTFVAPAAIASRTQDFVAEVRRLTGGRVSSENFTHGTSAQRMEALRAGMEAFAGALPVFEGTRVEEI